MFANQTGQFKHCHFFLSKNSFELVISKNIAFVSWVLAIMLTVYSQILFTAQFVAFDQSQLQQQVQVKCEGFHNPHLVYVQFSSSRLSHLLRSSFLPCRHFLSSF